MSVLVAGLPSRAEDKVPPPGRGERSATTSLDAQSLRPAAKKRIALIVGNSSYLNFADLRNPANDARAFGTVLRRLGFDVALGLDLDAAQFRKSIQKFLERIDEETVALFFYAGHGLQVNGLNYMLPTDAALASLSDLEFETIRFNLLLEPMERNSLIGIVFLDACRDNPLVGLAHTGTRSLATTRGLAPVQSGDGLFIGYATQPDNVAADGTGPNSPFTSALLRYIETPGFDIEVLMRRVRDDVLASTNRAQVPWSNSSLSGEGFSFKPIVATGEPATALPEDPAAAERQVELELWRSIGDSDDPALLEVYLRRYPEGIFADIARSRLKVKAKEKTKTVKQKPAPAPPAAKKTTTVKTKKTVTTQARTPAAESTASPQKTTGGLCRDGNIDHCRFACARGVQQACKKLRRMGL